MIKVHHLNFSRSSRVIWTLEELQIPYDVVHYQRDERFRAPPELKRVHSLGKAPVIEDGHFKLAESATILTYLNERHGNGRLTPTHGTDAAFLHDEWLQYAESSASLPILFKVLGGMMGGLPIPLDNFNDAELSLKLGYVAAGVTPGPYLMGDSFTLADIQLSYLMLLANVAGLLRGHPAIVDYLDRLTARPAFVRAENVGGPMVPPTSFG